MAVRMTLEEYIVFRREEERRAAIARVEARLRDIAAGAVGIGAYDFADDAVIASVIYGDELVRFIAAVEYTLELPDVRKLFDDESCFRDLAAAIVDAEKGGGDG